MTRAAPYDRTLALTTAMDLFWDKGFHATSLKDLEGALSMKPGSIYAAFKSKENLYRLALEQYFERQKQAVESQVLTAPSPVAALADFMRGFATQSDDRGSGQLCMLVKTMVDTQSTQPNLAEMAETHLDALKYIFKAAFDLAQQQGEIDADQNTAALALRYQAYLNAVRFELFRGTDPEAVKTLAEDMARQIDALGVSPAHSEQK